MPQTPTAVRPWLLCLICAIVAVIPRLFALDIPFDRDEGAYACVADTLARGDLPYADAFDHKPPGVFFIYHASFALFGRTVVAPRLAALLAVATAAFLLAQLVVHHTKHLPAALGSAILFGFSSTSVAIGGPTANTEMFTLPFIVGGIGMLTILPPRPILAGLGAGLTFGAAAMIKQPVALIGAATAIAAVLGLRKQPVVMLRACCAFALGAIIPFAGFCGLYAFQGNFAPFWDCFYRYNSDYITFLSWGESLQLGGNAVLSLFHDELLLWGLGLAGLLLAPSKNQASSTLPLRSWLIGSIGAVALGRTYYGHYFVFLLPILAYGVGLLLVRFSELGLGARRLPAVLAGCAALYYCPQWALPSNTISEAIFQETTFVRARALGHYLYENGNGDTGFILGVEPELYFYADLRPASRFIYGYPLATPNRHREDYRLEVQASLAATPPEWLIIQPALFDWQRDATFLAKLLTPFADYRLVAIERPDVPYIATTATDLTAASRSGRANRLLVFRRNAPINSPRLQDWTATIGLSLSAAQTTP